MNEDLRPKRCIIKVRVIPRTSRNQILSKEDGSYKVKITSPPVEGEANKALIGLLAKKMGVPKKSVEIVSGARSRVKTISVEGLSAREADELLKNS
ncbi:DUF167 domain-containing protein [Thermodesulfobacteriota bacterium]